MKIEQKKINEVKPYWRNPRKNERAVEAVMDSIKEYGMTQPILVDKKGVIIAGHSRYKAMLQLEYDMVYVVVSNMSEAKAKEYRIIDNKTAELADWDNEKLIPELREFKDLSKFTLHFPELKLPTIDRGSVNVGEQKYEVSDGAISEAEEKLRNQFTEQSKRFEDSSKLVTCPYCDEAFEIREAL